LNKTGNLRSATFILSFLPAFLVFTFFWVKHPERKNIPFIATIWWKIRYMQSKQIYEYTREVNENMSEDIRSQLNVYTIANDCIETLDNRLIKILEVPSINIDGLSNKERNRVLRDYKTFLAEQPINTFPIQINQSSQPI